MPHVLIANFDRTLLIRKENKGLKKLKWIATLFANNASKALVQNERRLLYLVGPILSEGGGRDYFSLPVSNKDQLF